MIKRVFAIFAIVSTLLCFFGCNVSENTDGYDINGESSDLEETSIGGDEPYYVVPTEWMRFCFSKKDFSEEEALKIASEAVFVMEDIRSYLDLNYTLEEAEGAVCYFDGDYLNDTGEERSMCFIYDRKMYCLSLDDFTHEYTHMVSGSCKDIVYLPEDVLVEGLAQYVSLNFHCGIASQEYSFFKEKSVLKSSDISEHNMLCELLSSNNIQYNAANYTKAFIAALDKNYGISKINKNDDYYKYGVGYIFTDYCIEHYGIEKFTDVYADSVIFTEVYGKTIEELILEACEYNTSAFYSDKKSSSN